MFVANLKNSLNFSVSSGEISLSTELQRISHLAAISQPVITCSKLTIETLKQDVKYVQS